MLSGDGQHVAVAKVRQGTHAAMMQGVLLRLPEQTGSALATGGINVPATTPDTPDWQQNQRVHIEGVPHRWHAATPCPVVRRRHRPPWH